MKRKLLSPLLFLFSFLSSKILACESNVIKKEIEKLDSANQKYSQKIAKLSQVCPEIKWNEVDKTIKEVSELNESILLGTEEFIWNSNLSKVPESLEKCSDHDVHFDSCLEKFLLDEYIQHSYEENNRVWINAVRDDQFQDRVGVLKSPIQNCTGTFIDKNHILTAFHCVAKDYGLYGTYSENYENFVYQPSDISFTFENARFQNKVEIKSIMPIPRYFSWSLEAKYDVAILEVKVPLLSISKLKLPLADTHQIYNLLNQKFVFSGFPARVLRYPTQQQSRKFFIGFDSSDGEITFPLMENLEGASGSLIRYWDGKEWAIVGVFSGTSKSRNVSIAAPILNSLPSRKFRLKP
ncbi:MAG: trypsin-like serine protease [Bacteriovoracaceae bacterium]|nr:trypsin-like serine protease [Bacteriovoracaceae bacterium]